MDRELAFGGKVKLPAGDRRGLRASIGQGQPAAECAAPGDDLPPIDPELAEVIEAWPTLPPAIREAILSMPRAAE